MDYVKLFKIEHGQLQNGLFNVNEMANTIQIQMANTIQVKYVKTILTLLCASFSLLSKELTP